jgi:hypothetical protein
LREKAAGGKRRVSITVKVEANDETPEYFKEN